MKQPTNTRPPVPSRTNALNLGGDPGSDQQSAGGAKNLWGSKDHRTSRPVKNFNIITYNIRTVKNNERLAELETELQDTVVKWHVIGLSENRQAEECLITLNSGHILYHTKASNGQQVVGFLIHKALSKNIIEVKQISARVATVKLNVNQRFSMKLIQVYAPTSSRPDEEVEQLYEEVQRQLTTDCHYHIVMGDFNAKIGIKSDEQERATGKFGSGERNERGDLLIEWATANNLKIMNTVYKKKISRRWTWQSPDGCTRNEIDYIMTNRPNIFTDVKVLNRLNAGSDHRAVMGVIRINVRKDRQKYLSNRSKRPSIEQLVIKKDEFQILLTNRFSALELEGEDGVDEMNDRITTTILECASESQ
ncbi:craniofacial development protein 2-like isoform X1 [Lingula anatina]|uniref:Craniofacial development protein 2-like isoform X1 n=1 Tax=Lingula anatina TaxID=7574 RepID=A0A1S3JCH2_LINAN|nr:craniofacial development protein 2-like isoform X1 [Lingula anatina]|eukprot:XP_013408096.1 craniofacial development protein 2-like isoform X1 [Lingula anatina]